ncbi:hypothetical protein PUNSTDRAFT_75478 [Punctularia strigosozonata HHB-11173 SS5]|uniref:MARVEL domain-containing protein n=1 Tax=Punctularia strigosozonata (strain HHB-11173) TaxID=741275 RepID=R7S514_PUNST|nr:uncharacterized protein PUNSTDRAFT_75478 [Punctularia strigosozonata HHB-11173 SS5]EIN04994.1 hypothetical protein PUNSTDRAFT_75478 [Punctularia strigosozonata HHB-11173 SS5]
MAPDDGLLLLLLLVPLVFVGWLYMIVSKPTIILHTAQTFFNFLAMCCFASVAAFQSHWGIGVSGLSGFTLFVTISGMFLALFMLLVPVMYEKYDKGARLARAMKEIRVQFILTGTGITFALLIAFIVTISAWTEPGCKNADKDPHEKLGDSFKNALGGWCNTKKAAAIFLWLAFVSWGGTLALTVRDWRSGAAVRPRDPPFQPPVMPSDHEDEFDDEESQYHQIPPAGRRPTLDNSDSPTSPFNDRNRYTYASSDAPPVLPRPSMDAYGAFSDPAPSGYGAGAGISSPTAEAPAVSRTMQYADPYAAVRASIAGAPAASTPPSYESYQGYR